MQGKGRVRPVGPLPPAASLRGGRWQKVTAQEAPSGRAFRVYRHKALADPKPLSSRDKGTLDLLIAGKTAAVRLATKGWRM